MELGSEGADLGGGAAFGAIHAKWQADDESVDLANFRQSGDPLDRIAFTHIDGFDGVREDAKVIRGGDADAGVAMVDAEGGVGRGWDLRSQI